MSGGPLFRVRLPRGEPMFEGHKTPEIYTTAGVVSRGRAGGMFAGFILDRCITIPVLNQ
jgi:hypothetical protein